MIKQNIKNNLKNCIICQFMNKKKRPTSKCVTKTRIFEQTLLDLLEITHLSGYVFVGIDYYTRYL